MDKAEDIISKLFNIQGNSESSAFMKAYQNWRSIIKDERLADHCKLEDIDKNSIRVSFDHPGWIQVFKMNQSMILKRLNTQYPNYSIKTAILHLKDDKFNERIYRKNADTNQAVQNKKNINVEDIIDEDLREKLKNLRKTLGKKS